MASAVIRRCGEEDWRDLRHLHVLLALGFPVVVDVELNEVLAAPDAYWSDFVARCAQGAEQAIFVAGTDGGCAGMGHVYLDDTLGRLDMLYVVAARRRQGVGAALVAALEEWALGAGVTGLLCHIPDVSSAGPLAERMGWHRTTDLFHGKHGLSERKWVKARTGTGNGG